MYWVEARHAAQHPAVMHRTALIKKNYLAPNVTGAGAEKP